MPIVNDPYGKWTDEELGKAIKQKSPGVYDKWDDTEIGNAMRVKATPQLGEVSKQARKNLANNLGQQTQNEYADEMRSALGQGMRSVAIPAVTAGVGLATGGLGLIPAALAVGGAGAATEYAAQTIDPSDNAARDIVKEALFSGVGEFGGRLAGNAIGGVLARRGAAAAAKAAEAPVVPAAVKAFAERASMPVAVPASKHGELWFNRALRTAISKDADEIMQPFGSAITPETAGQDILGVFGKIKQSTIDAGIAIRKQIAERVGDVPATTAAATDRIRDLASDLARQSNFPGRDEIIDQFKTVLRQGEIGVSLDQMLEFRSNVWATMEHMKGTASQKSYLKRLYGAVTEDVEATLAAHDPTLVTSFRKANQNIETYHKALENEVISRIADAAKEGNGTAVVRELFKSDPSEINAVKQFVQNTRPQDAAKFNRTIQQAAAQQILGVSEDGAPALGYKLAERLNKIGPDRLDTIFGWSKEGADTLSRLKQLSTVTSHYDNVLKYAPSLATEGSSTVGKFVSEATSAVVAGALGFKYIAARMGYNLARDAGQAVMAEIVSNPQSFRQFKRGYQLVMEGVTTGAKRLIPQGEAELKAALGQASARAIGMYRAQNSDAAKKAKASANAPAPSPFPYPGAGQ